MWVTDNVTLAREVQPAKALSPILATDSPNVMLAREVQPANAPFPMLVTDSPNVTLSREAQFLKARPWMEVTDSHTVMLAKEAQLSKARSPILVTDSPKAMLAREAQPWKALFPMWVTDSGILSKTSWCEFLKAASEILVTFEGILTPKHPCASMSCFAAASTSFFVYVTVTRGSTPKNSGALIGSASSMIELLRSSTTPRILRSIGSWQGCFSRSIIFNSRTVAVIRTSRVMTLPCKVFSLTLQDMAPKGHLTNRVASKMDQNVRLQSGRGQRMARYESG